MVNYYQGNIEMVKSRFVGEKNSIKKLNSYDIFVGLISGTKSLNKLTEIRGDLKTSEILTEEQKADLGEQLMMQWRILGGSMEELT